MIFENLDLIFETFYFFLQNSLQNQIGVYLTFPAPTPKKYSLQNLTKQPTC